MKHFFIKSPVQLLLATGVQCHYICVMLSRNPLLIFKRGLPGACALLRQNPQLRALWYDGESELIAELFRYVQPERLLVEASLVEALRAKCLGFAERKFEVVTLAEGTARNFQPCLLPSNDTHAFLFAALAKHSTQLKFRSSILKQEKAEQALASLGIAAQELQLDAASLRQFSLLLTANDWGTVELHAVRKFQDQGIPTACLQESVIDFASKTRRMEWSDFPLIQGLVTLNQLPGNIYFLTGNPRYEEIRPAPAPSRPRVLVNCNFTYGVFEDQRDLWLDAVAEACRAQNLDFCISQHPRDGGNLSRFGSRVLPSGADKVHEMIRQSSIVVTRFSSLIHEAQAMGRPVVYFNPHGEKMHYDFEADGRQLFMARSAHELTQALSTTEQPTVEDFTRYMNRHCGCGDGHASARVIQALKVISDGQTVLRPVPLLRYWRKALGVQRLRWRIRTQSLPARD